MVTLGTMRVFAGLAVLLVLVSAGLGAQLQSLAEPPVCPDPIPGVALNITFYPNKDDCSKYWECDNGNLYNGSCGDGLVWNPSVDSCDWSYNYDCPYDKEKRSVLPNDIPSCPQPAPGEFNVTFYPNEEDCSKYWECDNGNLKNASCPDGLIWNDDLKSCDWSYNYDCPYDKKKRGVIPDDIPSCPQPAPGEFNVTFYPNEEDCSKYWECDNGNLKNASCPDGLIWNDDLKSCDWSYNYDCPYDKKKRSVIPDEIPNCPQPAPGEFNVTFYPNEEDCTKYWECDNGNLKNASCPDGLIWNDDLKSCDWSYNYDCPYDKKKRGVIPDDIPSCPQPAPGEFNVTFYPNEEDCSKYWECDNGNLKNASCPDGLIWNDDLKSCDWSYNYDCPYDKKKRSVIPDDIPSCPQPAPGEFNVTFYPNEEDCSKYWECDNGNLKNASCPDGLIWNDDLKSCDWSYNYDCPYDKKKRGVIPDDIPSCPQPAPGEFNVTFYPNEEDCSKYWECDNGNLKNASCPDGLIWNDDLKSCDWSYNYDCPYDKKIRSVIPDEIPNCPQPAPGEFNVTFYPNEEDCTKYWECDNGNLKNASCPDGLIWNDDLKSCDWSYNYDCPYDKKKRGVIPDDIPSCPLPAPGEFNVTFYPNEEDCSKYWECDNGNLKNASCPDGLIWNDDLKSCDWSYNYDCPYDKKKRSVIPDDIPSCPQPAPGEFNVTFYPNEEDCSKYWECDNGNLKNASCPDGLIWNDDLKSCDWSYNYDCPYDKKKRSVIPDDIPSCPQPAPGEFNVTFYPNEEDCSKYWECDNGNLKNASCPDGLIWNDDLKSCDWSYNYDCPYDKKKRSVIPDDIPSCPQPAPGEFNVTFYPNEEDCSKYWECDNGNLKNASCPDGLIWNDDLKSCDWSYNYDCPYDKKKRSVIPDDIPSCPQPSPGEVFNVTFYPNEEDCTKYWECDNGNLKNASCPDGLIWNDDLKSCDWSYNYDCPYDKRRHSHPIAPNNELFTCPPVSPHARGRVMFFPNDADCHKYWVCLDGKRKEGSCQGDLVWNPNLRRCDLELNYPCHTDN